MRDGGLSHCSVLVVEDETLVAFDLEAMLQDLGFGEIVICETIDRAREEMEARHFHAAVFDLNVDGELTTPLIDIAVARGAFTVIASGYDVSEIDAVPGDVRRLTKPYTEDDVARVFADFAPPGS